MKVIGFREVDGYKIVASISEGSIDPEATKAEVAKQAGVPVEKIFQLPNYRELFQEHKVYFSPGTNQLSANDAEAENLLQSLKTLEPHQCLCTDGGIIPDFVNTEYWAEDNGRWDKRKIERIGKEPDGILQEDLTPEQQEEIRAQEEQDRIALMSPEELMEAQQRELDALADEAARLEKRAQIQQKAFDPIAWYQKAEQNTKVKYGGILSEKKLEMEGKNINGGM